jgi:hypothetical protein
MNDSHDDQAVIVQTRLDGGTTEDNHEATERPSESINSQGDGLGPLGQYLMKVRQITGYRSTAHAKEFCSMFISSTCLITTKFKLSPQVVDSMRQMGQKVSVATEHCKIKLSPYPGRPPL